jgi:lysophospholipase L1-like esterase
LWSFNSTDYYSHLIFRLFLKPFQMIRLSHSAIAISMMLSMFILSSCTKNKDITVWLIGDSTMADYANYGEDYMKERYPQTGWGQTMHHFMHKDSLKLISVMKADSVRIDNRAKGGRSTRSFFEEGRWTNVYNELQSGDWVLIQFGHNDASKSKTERYVDIPGYKEFLRYYITQCRDKGAVPVLITSVCRNYPWENDQLYSSHGDYPDAMKEVAAELDVYLVDLTALSAESFTQKGREYVTQHYFMNLPAGKYEAYPEGMTDNTHFQPEGAMEVARLVFLGLKKLE